MNDKNHFSINLRTLRKEQKLSRWELSEILNVSTDMVRYWETGANSCPHQYLIAIAIFFNITVDELISEKQMKIISYNIATCRTAKGLTQEKLANELGITRTRLASWEEHRAEPNIEFIIKLAEFFAMSIDLLLKVRIK